MKFSSNISGLYVPLGWQIYARHGNRMNVVTFCFWGDRAVLGSTENCFNFVKSILFLIAVFSWSKQIKRILIFVHYSVQNNKFIYKNWQNFWLLSQHTFLVQNRLRPIQFNVLGKIYVLIKVRLMMEFLSQGVKIIAWFYQ